VSDLNSSTASYAEQQLQARGFNQTRSIPPSNGFSNSWWLNSRTNQCFQLETANGKVMTLNPRTSQDLPQFRCNQDYNQNPNPSYRLSEINFPKPLKNRNKTPLKYIHLQSL
jgi:hypothetical protein